MRLLIVITSFVVAIVYSIYYNLDHRVSNLEGKGEVTVELEPIPEETPEPPKKVLSSLENIRLKIIMDKDDLMCLAKNIYYEARGEPYIGKISVAQITFNRVLEGRWGDTICEVVYAKKQFSWTNTKQKPPHGKAWNAAWDAAKAFQYGVRVTTLKDSNHYHNPSVSPTWKEKMNRTAVIAKHIFYAGK